MYETIKTKIVSAFTFKRVICGVLSVLIIGFACSLIGGYIDTRADYQRTREQLDRTQRALDASRKLNQQLRESIATSKQLNRDAGNSINRIEDYQRRTDEGIGRAQNYQQETERRVSESVANNNRASELIGDSLRIIERVESGNKE